jgi:biopolymer transport protein ExbD
MLARPLDLASRLQPPSKRSDALAYVNVGLIAVFFSLFGSRFVLAPGLGVEFRLPEYSGTREAATATTCHVSVLHSGQIFTDDGLLSLAELRAWLKDQAERSHQPRLLIQASAGVTLAELSDIQSAAHEAGFAGVVWAADDPGMRAGRTDGD